MFLLLHQKNPTNNTVQTQNKGKKAREKERKDYVLCMLFPRRVRVSLSWVL